MIHSILSGIGACLALCDSAIWEDMVHFYSPLGSKIVKMSTGYFLYDFYHVLAINEWKWKECWELVVHHIIVLRFSMIILNDIYFYSQLHRDISLLRLPPRFFLPRANDGNQYRFPPCSQSTQNGAQMRIKFLQNQRVAQSSHPRIFSRHRKSPNFLPKVQPIFGEQ